MSATSDGTRSNSRGGKAGNAKTDGLRLLVTAAAPGSLGTIRLFNGLANAAQQAIDRTTSTDSGPIQSQEDSIQTRIDDLQQTIQKHQEESKRREDALRQEFNKLESSLAEFQNQSSYLSAQLAKL